MKSSTQPKTDHGSLRIESVDVLAEVHRRLKFWAIWRRVEDDPGCGYPKKVPFYTPPGLGDVWEQSDVTDWAEAVLTDDAVKTLEDISPLAYHAIMARYRTTDDVFETKAEREQFQLAQFQRYTKRPMSGSRFRALISEGRKLLAMRLAK